MCSFLCFEIGKKHHIDTVSDEVCTDLVELAYKSKKDKTRRDIIDRFTIFDEHGKKSIDFVKATMNEKILSNMVFNKLKEYYKFAHMHESKIDMDIGTVKKKIKEVNQ